MADIPRRIRATCTPLGRLRARIGRRLLAPTVDLYCWQRQQNIDSLVGVDPVRRERCTYMFIGAVQVGRGAGWMPEDALDMANQYGGSGANQSDTEPT